MQKNRENEPAVSERGNERPIRIWRIIHSSLCILFGILFYWGKRTPFFSFLNFSFIFYGYLIFVLLFTIQKRNVFTVQNIITTLRLFIGLMVFLWLHFQPSFSFWTFLALVIGGATDFIDGWIARLKRTTRFGAQLDMELDAFFILILSFIGFIYGDFGAWLLWIGFMRYIYEFFLIFLSPILELPLLVKYSEKSICAFAVISLISITAPFFPQAGKIIINRGALILLALSFLLNFLVHLFRKKSRSGNDRMMRDTLH